MLGFLGLHKHQTTVFIIFYLILLTAVPWIYDTQVTVFPSLSANITCIKIHFFTVSVQLCVGLVIDGLYVI